MNLRSNVNKLHSDLSSNYENVKIEENSDKDLGNYIEFNVFENNKQLIVKIKKYELEKDTFNWSYLSDPEDTTSVVERVSNINNFVIDVQDIFNKNRFDSEYLKKLS